MQQCRSTDSNARAGALTNEDSVRWIVAERWGSTHIICVVARTCRWVRGIRVFIIVWRGPGSGRRAVAAGVRTCRTPWRDRHPPRVARRPGRTRRGLRRCTEGRQGLPAAPGVRVGRGSQLQRGCTPSSTAPGSRWRTARPRRSPRTPRSSLSRQPASSPSQHLLSVLSRSPARRKKERPPGVRLAGWRASGEPAPRRESCNGASSSDLACR
jgi:hypothetical protein